MEARGVHGRQLERNLCRSCRAFEDVANDRGADQPLIWIERADYGRLLRAMDWPAVQAPEVQAFLSRELDRAIVRPESDLPWTIVRMGSRVLFRRADDTPAECGELVYPDQVPTEGQITLASPWGLPCSVSARVHACLTSTPTEVTRCLSVERFCQRNFVQQLSHWAVVPTDSGSRQAAPQSVCTLPARSVRS
ncbi:MAG TPA: hypothetical protein VD978_20115 [Azospirillum sp.]|nr:hypothetical protein [Azospirillum sp.]